MIGCVYTFPVRATDTDLVLILLAIKLQRGFGKIRYKLFQNQFTNPYFD